MEKLMTLEQESLRLKQKDAQIQQRIESGELDNNEATRALAGLSREYMDLAKRYLGEDVPAYQ